MARIVDKRAVGLGQDEDTLWYIVFNISFFFCRRGFKDRFQFLQSRIIQDIAYPHGFIQFLGFLLKWRCCSSWSR